MGRSLTSLATSSPRCRPYLATTGRSTSVTGLVGLALSPTDRLIGTRSNLFGEGETCYRHSSAFTEIVHVTSRQHGTHGRP